MKCSNCKSEMEKGFTDFACWISGDVPMGKRFLKGRVKFGMWPAKRKVEYITAWRCPSCGKIDIYAEK